MPLVPSDWSSLFGVETPLLELIVRALLIYVGILFLLRILPRRTGGEVAHMDLIFMLLIAEAATHSMGDFKSLTEAMIVIVTMVVLNYAINALSFHFPPVERMITARPLEIVREGEALDDNLRREFLTREELMGILRQSGIDDLAKVKRAMVEGKGKVSIVKEE